MRVLIAEDDESIAAPLAKGLSREGLEVERLTRGEAALGRLSDGGPQPDVVLLDLGLPDVDGFDVSTPARRV